MPSIQIQEKIADILYLLDEKIAINVAVNDNLQEQAFALFDQLMLDAGDSKCLVTEIAYINPKRPLKKIKWHAALICHSSQPLVHSLLAGK